MKTATIEATKVQRGEQKQSEGRQVEPQAGFDGPIKGLPLPFQISSWGGEEKGKSYSTAGQTLFWLLVLYAKATCLGDNCLFFLPLHASTLSLNMDMKLGEL